MRVLILFFSAFMLYAQTLDMTNPNFQNLATSQNSLDLIDSSQFEAYSLRTYRYSTRLDKKHKINIYGIGGSANSQNLESSYGGVVLTYDMLIGRVPLGVIATYTAQFFNAKNSDSEVAHNAQLGFYTDFFIGAHQIQAQAIQSMNIPQATSQSLATTTNFSARYGYVFTLNSYGSHLKPFFGVNAYFLYNADKNGLSLDDYNLNVNLDFGLQFLQFITQHFHFYITPIFRQDVGVINSDPFMRLIVVNLDGSVDFSMPDERYRSYGILKAGLNFNLGKNASLKFGFDGRIASQIHTLNGNITLNILF